METVVKTFLSTPTLWGVGMGRATPFQSDQVPTGLAVLRPPGVPNSLSSTEFKKTQLLDYVGTLICSQTLHSFSHFPTNLMHLRVFKHLSN